MNRYKTINIDTASPNAPGSSILLIYTGGTMGMATDENGVLIPFDFELIPEHIPSLNTFDLHLKVVAFEDPIDSSSINPSHWAMMGSIICDHYDLYDGFVILHGTDTMAYTASALSFMLEGLGKPVVFTGAQLPITSARTDGRENIITAIEIASAKGEEGRSIIREVCICFDSLLLRGNRTQKVESQHFDAFQSENCPPLAEAGINIEYNYPVINQYRPGSRLTYHQNCSSDVAILKLFPGISKPFVEAVLNTDGLKGVIMETYGAGNAPADVWFVEQLREAIEKGILVMNVSQCSGGKVIQGKYATSVQLKSIGVIDGDDITTEAAITKMMVSLAQSDIEKPQLKKMMNQPICAEMSQFLSKYSCNI